MWGIMGGMSRVTTLVPGIVLAIVFSPLPSTALGGDSITAEFLVKVPEDTPREGEVIIVGDRPEAGSWRPEKGLRLERRDDGRFAGKLELAPGSRLAYKVVLGSWRGVEKSAEGREIPNRTIEPRTSAAIEIEVARWADPSSPPQSAPKPTVTGTLRRHPRFPSKLLGRERDVFVYLPPGYEEHPERRHPVFYLHDGQNLFDAGSAAFGVEWGVDEAAERLIRDGRLEPVIIVGIANTSDRLAEYAPLAPTAGAAPAVDAPTSTRFPPPRGELYARFLLEELKPFIDASYRTLPGREHTAIGGSSLGGLISLWICSRHTDRFCKCAALSPALQWNEQQILREVEKDGGWLRRVKLWLDMGTAEGRREEGQVPSALANTRRLVEILDRNRCAPGRDYYYFEDFGAEHNEAAWARRIDEVLLFLFGVEQ
jgi:predicted alpha/beta superfamily hydrolase